MSSLSVFSVIPRSFYSAELYREVARTWTKRSFSYLFFLLVLAWIPLMITAEIALIGIKKVALTEVVPQLPEININNGKASTTVSGPVTINMRKDEKLIPLAIIDTSGAVLSFENTEALILVMQNRMIIKRNEVEQRTIEFSKFDKIQFNQAKATEWINKGYFWIALLMVPVAILFSYMFRLIQAAFYALVGLAIDSFVHAKLNYTQLYALSVMAITPPIVLGVVLDILGIFDLSVPFAGILMFVVAMWYLYFGIKACRDEMSTEIN